MTDPGRVDPPFHADERTMLSAYLDYHRATLVWKVSGLSKTQLAQTMGASSLTLAGLVKHLTLVEDSWFTERMAGGEAQAEFRDIDWEADPDYEFRTALEEEPADLLAAYAAACERSRAVVAATPSLDARAASTKDPITLRWILVHMIEETARHNGHADLLREAIDGETGE